MEVRNLMGGVVAAWYIPVSGVDAFWQDAGKAVVALAPGCQWIELPLNYMAAVPDDDPQQMDESGGIVHNVSFSALIRADRISAGEAVLLALAVEKEGILVKAQYVDGRKVVIGSCETPLFGYLKDVPGKEPKDSNPLSLAATGECTHGPLEISEGMD